MRGNAQGKRKFEVIKIPKLGILVTVYIRTAGEKKGQFVAQYGPDEVESASYPEIERKIHEMINAQTQLQWFPVIDVSVEPGEEWAQRGARKHVVKIIANRYYVAKVADTGKWRVATWDTKPEDRIGNSSEIEIHDHAIAQRTINFGALPDHAQSYGFNHRPGEVTHYLPYDEKTWEGIQWICSQLQALAERLQDLISSVEGRAMIASKALRMLAAPEVREGGDAEASH